jgi:hypothetical protein
LYFEAKKNRDFLAAKGSVGLREGQPIRLKGEEAYRRKKDRIVNLPCAGAGRRVETTRSIVQED